MSTLSVRLPHSLHRLQQRADRGKRSAYDKVLRRVRDVAPEERDALPNNGTKAKRG